MDRGYANFQIESTQVAIAPEKDDMYITVNVTEGDVFKVSEIKLAGTMVVPEYQLRALLLIKPGDIFSRKAVTSSQELIELTGSEPTAMRSPRSTRCRLPTTTRRPCPSRSSSSRATASTCGTSISNQHHRHQRRDAAPRNAATRGRGGCRTPRSSARRSVCSVCPMSRRSSSRTSRSPAAPIWWTWDYNIKEGLPGQFGGGIGYSESQKFSLNGNFVHSNFMGTGDRIALEINAGKYSKSYVFSYTDPYARTRSSCCTCRR